MKANMKRCSPPHSPGILLSVFSFGHMDTTLFQVPVINSCFSCGDTSVIISHLHLFFPDPPHYLTLFICALMTSFMYLTKHRKRCGISYTSLLLTQKGKMDFVCPRRVKVEK